MSKNKLIECRLDGVIALPASCADAEKKLLSAIAAVKELHRDLIEVEQLWLGTA